MTKKMFALMFAFTVVFTGCGYKLDNNMPCTSGAQCVSGVCTGNTCVGRNDGDACSAPAECASSQCEGSVCVPQTCNPVCLAGDVCLGTAVNRCAAGTASYNGEVCYTGDRGCLSLKCNAQICEGRSDGAFCTMKDQCGVGSDCLNGVCQPTGSTCTPTCSVGQKCVSGTCTNVLLGAKEACVDNADCASGFCDAGPRNYWTCRAGQACTPTYPSASTVSCGTPVLPNNGCGTTQNGTGSYCATGVCNGTSCVTTGLVNGSSCTLNTDCNSGNCGNKFATNKICLGNLERNSVASVATDCRSGVFIQGTNLCAPDQFVGCAPGSAYYTFAMFNEAGVNTRTVQVSGVGRCVMSNPALNELTGITSDLACIQHSNWTGAGIKCRQVGQARHADWNAGRP